MDGGDKFDNCVTFVKNLFMNKKEIFVVAWAVILLPTMLYIAFKLSVDKNLMCHFSHGTTIADKEQIKPKP